MSLKEILFWLADLSRLFPSFFFVCFDRGNIALSHVRLLVSLARVFIL